MINKLVKENFYKTNAKCRKSQETRHVKINLLLCDAIWINLCIKFRLQVGGDDGKVAAVILQSGRKPEGDKQNNRRSLRQFYLASVLEKICI